MRGGDSLSERTSKALFQCMGLDRAYQEPSAVNVVLPHRLLTVLVVQLHREAQGAISATGSCGPPFASSRA